MSVRSIQPRRQRKAQYEADLFERRRKMAVPLSRELRKRYGRRSLVVRKGDTVRILSGSYVGREERVAKVSLRKYAVTLDNITGKTAEAKLKPLPVQPSHLLLTRLNLADPWRRRLLRVPEAEIPPETDTEAEPATESAEPSPAEPKGAEPKAEKKASPKTKGAAPKAEESKA